MRKPGCCASEFSPRLCRATASQRLWPTARKRHGTIPESPSKAGGCTAKIAEDTESEQRKRGSHRSDCRGSRPSKLFSSARQPPRPPRAIEPPCSTGGLRHPWHPAVNPIVVGVAVSRVSLLVHASTRPAPAVLRCARQISTTSRGRLGRRILSGRRRPAWFPPTACASTVCAGLAVG